MGVASAIIGSAILGAAGSAIGGSKSASAAKSATNAQTNAANQNLALQREVYYDQRGLQQPYYQAGLQGLYGQGGVMDLMGMGQPRAAPQAQMSQPQMPGMVNAGGGQFRPGGSSEPMVMAGPSNAFASGTYGASVMGQPTPTSGPDYAAYLQANPDVAQWAVESARQPHFTRGAGKTAADYNGDGALTSEEMARHHYEMYGRTEGRQIPQYAPQAPQASQAPAQPVQADPGAAPITPANDAAQPAPVDPRTQSLRQTPGYQFQLDEARRGVENSFASRGKLLSGSAMKALSDRSQGLADNTYQQTLNNAFNLTNIGMGSAAQIQGAGQNYATGAGNAFTNIGNAQASGAINQANAFNAGFQGIYNSAMGGLGAYGAYRNWSGNPAPAASTAPVTGTFNGIGWGGR